VPVDRGRQHGSRAGRRGAPSRSSVGGRHQPRGCPRRAASGPWRHRV